MQKLLDARFFPRAVDVGDLVFWEAAVVLVHLGNNRGDGGDAPGRAVSPRTEQPTPSAMIISRYLKRGSRTLLRFPCPFFSSKEGSGRAAAPAARYRLLRQPPEREHASPAAGMCRHLPRQGRLKRLRPGSLRVAGYLSLHLHQNPPGLFCCNLWK